MPSTFIEGSIPLTGDITVSGSKNSSLKLIVVAMFSNQDVVLENVPRIKVIEDDLEIIRSLGGSAEWAGDTLILNGAGLSSSEIRYELGSRLRTVALLSGPLLFRFGKASIPKFNSEIYVAGPINRLVDTWKTLGVEIKEDDRYYHLNAENMASSTVVFKTSTHMGTDNAILCSLFLDGETIIVNASEEAEIEDLILMVNQMGGNVERVEPRKIRVIGTNIFKDAKFSVLGDKTEAAIFASGAILTNGNVTIKGIKKETLIPFVNFLNKIDAKFEICENELKVWRHEEDLTPAQVEIAPTPGFVPDWQSLATIILTQASGESLVHDTVYTNRFSYVIDLNRMGAKISNIKPTEVDLIPVISEDSYDFEVQGEPKSVVKIEGPTRLKGEKLNIGSFINGPVLVLAALCAEGKSEIIGMEHIEKYLASFSDKLKSLGAKIWEQ